MESNFEAALRAETKKCVRCFHAYSSEQRANLAANFRAGYQQRRSMGEFFWTHPDVPGIAFPTRKRAALAALSRADSTPNSDCGEDVDA
jgi:hypothetical protein